MSDRDKKIIIFLLIVMVIVLPYIFYIKNTKVETETILVKVQELETRLKELQDMDKNRGFWEDEIVRLHKDMDKIIESFPAGVDSANYTMFLLQTEYSSDTILNEETGEAELQYPIIFDSVAFAENIEMPIATEETDTGYVALTNVSAVTYACYYGGLKYLLDYLKEYEDPMIYSSIDMEFDDETGVITGTILLSQYAISGADRELPATNFTIDIDGVIDRDMNLDLDEIDRRGNEDVEAGVFGPVIKEGALEAEQDTEAPEEAVE